LHYLKTDISTICIYWVWFKTGHVEQITRDGNLESRNLESCFSQRKTSMLYNKLCNR